MPSVTSVRVYAFLALSESFRMYHIPRLKKTCPERFDGAWLRDTASRSTTTTTHTADNREHTDKGLIMALLEICYMIDGNIFAGADRIKKVTDSFIWVTLRVNDFNIFFISIIIRYLQVN